MIGATTVNYELVVKFRFRNLISIPKIHYCNPKRSRVRLLSIVWVGPYSEILDKTRPWWGLKLLALFLAGI